MIYINIYGSRIPFPPGEEIDLLLRKSDIEEIKHHQLVIKNREGRTIPLGALLYEDDAFNLVEPSEEERKIYPALSVAVLSPDLDKAIKYVNYFNRYGFEAMKMGSLKTYYRLNKEQEFDIAVISFDFFKQNLWKFNFPVLVIVENAEQQEFCVAKGTPAFIFNEASPWMIRDVVYGSIMKKKKKLERTISRNRSFPEQTIENLCLKSVEPEYAITASQMFGINSKTMNSIELVIVSNNQVESTSDNDICFKRKAGNFVIQELAGAGV